MSAMVYVGGRRIKLDPSRLLGTGGEADVFDIGGELALKLYKGPDHPDLRDQPEQQRAASERLATRGAKLRELPRPLPSRLVAPVELATDRWGRAVLGYTMQLVRGAEPLLRYSEPTFRARVTHAATARLLTLLHDAVDAAHRAGLVIGDFNDLNVLVAGDEPHLIDCDSYQFGRWLCDVFTERFVDPLLCDPAATTPQLLKPFTRLSDWYAFTVMVMQCLLYVGPYGGVYRPQRAHPTSAVTQAARPLHRITVFHPEVIYPRPALPYRTLPDDLLQHLHLTFEKDRREPFPRELVEHLRWTRCSACGAEHARPICPHCVQVSPASLQESITVRGEVTARTVVRTRGLIVWACLEDGDELRWLCHEGGSYRREDGNVVVSGELDPQVRVRLQGRNTLLARGGLLRVIDADGREERLSVDACGTWPAFDCNERVRFWVDNGRLLRSAALGPAPVGDVLAGQTRLWVGPTFGAGVYRAGGLSVAFLFDAERRGINDSVRLPWPAGRLVDATCTLSETHAWLLLATDTAGRLSHHCFALGRRGDLLAAATATAGDGSWLGALRGKCAAGSFLFAATDAGVVRVEHQGGAITTTREYPDTAPFLHSGSRLLVGRRGIYAVGGHTIVQLSLAQRAGAAPRGQESARSGREQPTGKEV